MKIYADNAATTKLDPEAFDDMTPFFLDEYANASQPYAFAYRPKKALKEARRSIAESIGADPDEIFFTSGGSESDNWVIKSTPNLSPEKTTLITSAFEHHAVLNACQDRQIYGVRVVSLPPSPQGFILPQTLKNELSERVNLVSIMFANNEIGTVQPIAQLCKLTHQCGAYFHTDAVQAVGHLPIHVHQLGVDFLSASAHKFNGPKGIGFLYVRRGVPLPPYVHGGAQENHRRAGTENIPAIVGMATALRNHCSHLDENRHHLHSLESLLLSRLDHARIPYHRNGAAPFLPGLLSLSFPHQDGEALLHRLDLMGIAVSTGAACDSRQTQISHVLQAIQLDPTSALGTIRISLGKYNTIDDVETIAHALIKILHNESMG